MRTKDIISIIISKPRKIFSILKVLIFLICNLKGKEIDETL